ncbi:MAG: hypothetical protein ACREJD_03805 [Phycisphaerales bacterium]
MSPLTTTILISAFFLFDAFIVFAVFNITTDNDSCVTRCGRTM